MTASEIKLLSYGSIKVLLGSFNAGLYITAKCKIRSYCTG